MFVKICGITNPDDALAAVAAGAGALGFIFVSSSPRHVTVQQVEPWIKDIPAGIMKVGVFADETPEFVEQIGSRLGLDVAQLHGGETPDRHPRGMRVWKAFRVKDSQASLADYPPDYPDAEAILIDGYDYAWPKTERFTRPLILAGRLTENNVRDRVVQARRTTDLWAVDVSSGIESSPGRKDHARMKKFIEAALRF